MRLTQALSRLTGSSSTSDSITITAAPMAAWRSDESITAAALRGGAREHEIDAVLRAVRGEAPAPVPPEVDAEVRAALEAVRVGGPVRYSAALYGDGTYAPVLG